MSNGLDDEIDGYMDEGVDTFMSTPGYPSAPTAAPAPSPRPPVQNFAPPMPRTGPMVSVLFRGLGDFDVLGRCAIVALSRVAWLFWSKVADGQTTTALGILELFRSLWNLKRDAIASGFAGHGQEYLPGVLPAAEWSQPMRYAMAYSIAGATGFSTDIATVLARMPDSMAALPAWFPTLVAVLPAVDLPSARTYVDAPLPSSGDPVVYYAGYVRDDLNVCGAPAAPAPSPSPPPTGAPVTLVPTSVPIFTPSPSRTGGSSGAGGGSGTGPRTNSSGGLAVLIVLALIGYGGYLAVQDSKPKEKSA